MKSGCQVELVAARQQLGAVRQGRDEPLARGDDLQGPLALLVELDRVGDRTRLAHERPALSQLVDHGGAGLVDGAPGDLGVVGVGRGRVARGEVALAEGRPGASARRAR